MGGLGHYRKQWRGQLFEKQSGLCFYCKKEMSLTSRTKTGAPARNFATFEHLQRLIDGGRTNSHNVVLAHRICNHVANIEAQRQKMSETIKDPFDQFWEWANKPVDSMLTIPVEIHGPVMELSEENRRDRDKVNEAVGRGAQRPEEK